MIADPLAATRPRLHGPRWWWVPLLIVLAPLAGTAMGETPIALDTVWRALANQLWDAGHAVDPIDQGIIWSYRLPRALVAGACGAGLAISGLMLQTLLRNALADPYLLGISAGASTGAVLVAVAGVGIGSAALPMSVGALAGALAAFALVVGLARLAGGGPTARGAAQIVLAGIAGSQLFSALTSFIIARSASAEQARGIMFWLLGNLSGVRWGDVGLSMGAVAIAMAVALWHVRALDAFTFGTESAASLGVPVRRVQAVLILATAGATAVLVSITGAIGFVGLVVPHAARFLVGTRHSRLVPVSALIGMVFLIAADVIARMLVPGQTLPIGVVTALIGAPAFAVILIRARPTS
ncbi:FecCD family ABC transporter permease [Paracoccus nototheniae]|uniref:FecCD family ABC transporter permease n=1 Tax=Paracoccus nototheniae TaxID=2489002 RepID=A0ABW4E0P3_9RHOB|nr:iron ABC transporter permease [Paracoccus nototheniae]